MAKKPLHRQYRASTRSAEEAARDAEVRRQVREEFPPLEGDLDCPVLRDPLKEAIAQSPKSVPQLATEARISPVVLAQFVAGQRDLRVATAEKLAHVLGLKLMAK